jgi:hypothetical protein
MKMEARVMSPDEEEATGKQPWLGNRCLEHSSGTVAHREIFYTCKPNIIATCEDPTF